MRTFLKKTALVVFGIFAAFILLEIGLRLGGFVILSLQEARNRASLSQKAEYRILCLGESTTQNQYPAFLEEALNRSNIGIKFSVIDKGIIGTNTDFILQSIESNLDIYRPDMVITMMGINDKKMHMSSESVSDPKFMNCLRYFRTYKLARLLWLRITTKPEEQGCAKKKGVLLNKELLESKQAVELNPENYDAYIKLGTLYQEEGMFFEAEASFQKAMELIPRESLAYEKLGTLYRMKGIFSKSEALFKKVIELNPEDGMAYVRLGWFYQQEGMLAEAEALFKKARELNTENGKVYIELGIFYKNKGMLSEAEALFRKAIELDSKDCSIYAKLGRIYRKEGRFFESTALLKKAIELASDDYKIEKFKAVLALSAETGIPEDVIKYNERAEEFRLSYNPLVTIKNYHKLKIILDKRGVRYICAQYPMCDLGQLKKIFQGEEKGIIFVDNEKIFKDAVEADGFRYYFADTFGGNFGHCTDKGNRLLAENMANTILKEVFNK